MEELLESDKELLIRVNNGTSAFELSRETKPGAFARKMEGLERLHWNGLISVYQKEPNPSTGNIEAIYNVYVTSKGEDFIESIPLQES